MGTAVLLLAPEIVALVARLPDYDGAVLPLRILAVSLAPLYLDMILGTLLIASDRQRQWAIISVGAALINPLLNWWLIRQTQATLQNGAVGAALVTLLTEVGIFVAYVWAQPRGLLGRPNLTFAGRVLLATAAMAAAIGLLLPVLQAVAPGGPTQRLGAAVVLLGAGGAGGIVFGGLALALRLVGPAEWRLVRRALRRGAA